MSPWLRPKVVGETAIASAPILSIRSRNSAALNRRCRWNGLTPTALKVGSDGTVATSGGGGGGGCVPAGAANQVLLDSGSGSCNDATLDNTATHAFFATAGAPAFRAIAAGDIPTLNQSTTGNAATATNLASYPALCSGVQFSQGLSSGSNNCGTPAGGGNVSAAGSQTPGYFTEWISGSGKTIGNGLADDGITTANTFTYAGTGGIAASAGPIQSTSDGTHAGSLQLVGNTTAPTLAANSWGFVGPNSASFTKWFIQPPAVGPAASVIPVLGAISSSLSAMSLYALSGTGTTIPTTVSPTFTTPALGTPSAVNLSNATSLPCAAMPALTGAVTTTAGSCATSPAVADTTTTVGTTAIGANSCTSSATTVTMTGVTTAMTFSFTPTSDTHAVTGWGGTGGLKINAWPTSNTLNYYVCNQTASSITPGGSVTFNVSAR